MNAQRGRKTTLREGHDNMEKEVIKTKKQI